MKRTINVTASYNLDELKGLQITPKEKVKEMVTKQMIDMFGWDEGYEGVEVEVIDTVNKEENLSNCPFCGGEAELKEIDYDPNWQPTFYDPDSGGDAPTYVVNCKKCSASTLYKYNKKDAMNAWNNRR